MIESAIQRLLVLGLVCGAGLLAPPTRPACAEEIVIIGSGNVAKILERAAPLYAGQRPGTTIVIESRPSSAGPPALLGGRAQLAGMSREMTADERHAFEQTRGAEPERVSIAIDALAIFVQEDNPLREITIPQLDAIFSRDLGCGASTPIARWGELGIKGDWERRQIGLYGHVPSAGTHAFFRAHALCGGHFRPEVIEQPGGASIVHSVAESRFAMGYSARADRIEGVRTLNVAATAAGPYASVDAKDVDSGAYPLTRDLYLYWLDDPATPDRVAEVREFLRFLLGESGQQAAEAAGFLRLPRHRAASELRRLE